MNAATLSKGQRVEYKSALVKMVNGEFANVVTIKQGLVVGNSQKGISIRADGDKRSWLVSKHDIIKVL